MCMCLNRANQINVIEFNVLSHRWCSSLLDSFHCCVKPTLQFSNILFHTFFFLEFRLYFSVSPAIGDLAYQTYATVPSTHVADVKREPWDLSLLVPQRAGNPTFLPHTNDGAFALLSVVACVRAHVIFLFFMTAVELFCCVFATSRDAHCCCDSGAFFFHFGRNCPSFRLFFSSFRLMRQCLQTVTKWKRVFPQTPSESCCQACSVLLQRARIFIHTHTHIDKREFQGKL